MITYSIWWDGNTEPLLHVEMMWRMRLERYLKGIQPWIIIWNDLALLTALEIVTEENEKLREANRQVEAPCESQRSSMAALRTLSSSKASGYTMLSSKPRVSLLGVL